MKDLLVVRINKKNNNTRVLGFFDSEHECVDCILNDVYYEKIFMQYCIFDTPFSFKYVDKDLISLCKNVAFTLLLMDMNNVKHPDKYFNVKSSLGELLASGNYLLSNIL